MAVGEFEYLLLAAIVRLGDEAYGLAIRQEIEENFRIAKEAGLQAR